MSAGLFTKGSAFFHGGGKETNNVQVQKEHKYLIWMKDICTLFCTASLIPVPLIALQRLMPLLAALTYALSDHRNLRLPTNLLPNIECSISANSLTKSSGHKSW